MKRILLLSIFISILWGPAHVLSQGVADYLILQDIGQFRLTKPEKMFPGEPPSGGPRTYDGDKSVYIARHFIDHIDKSYEVMYLGGGANSSPTVKVAQHVGGDSDKWLRHEIELPLRTYYGIPGETFATRIIDGNTIIADGSGGWTYLWLSNNKVIEIGYTDLQLEKDEPLEVLKAYLAKHPSTLTPVTSYELRTAANETKWIKDEMERRLWLCDKWFMALQLEKAVLKEVLEESVINMLVFLEYRDKYYGISARAEKRLLWIAQEQKDGTTIKNKREEYKTWWKKNKDKRINL